MTNENHGNFANMVLAQNIKRLRTQSGLTQSQLAERIGISYPRISEIERQEGNPTLATIEKLANFFNVSSAFLLSEQKNKQIA
jgi:transcriptional regulator with XRE-family HTH domain